LVNLGNVSSNNGKEVTLFGFDQLLFLGCSHYNPRNILLRSKQHHMSIEEASLLPDSRANRNECLHHSQVDIYQEYITNSINTKQALVVFRDNFPYSD
jgi:hypothetical protein